MVCPRCAATHDDRTRWCKSCEAAYDQWVRRHATDIIWSVMAGGVVIGVIGLGLPLLGVGSPVAFAAAFAGFGTILGLYRLGQRRRRRQFLDGAQLPRAYLPAPK
ncbi:MAG TPA: hypothetical protein VLX92_01000 [Kofleriaceae bacterium]|nr:hypothetical protein [Kofleriaceae bacterium]